MVTNREYYFAITGINRLPKNMFWDTSTNLPLPGVTNQMQLDAFDEHAAALNPEYRQYCPHNAQGYTTGGVYRPSFVDVDLLGTTNDPGFIDEDTEWTGTPPTNHSIDDNPVPKAGLHTHGDGPNRRNNTTEHHKFEINTKNGDLKQLFNCGYGGVLNVGFGRVRESSFVGIDGYVRAESQARADLCIIGVCNVWAMYISTLRVEDIVLIIEFIQCIIDDDCTPDPTSLPGNGKANPLMDNLVGILGNANVELSEESQRSFEERNFTPELIQEIKSKFKDNNSKITDYYRPMRQTRNEMPDIELPVLENVLNILIALVKALEGGGILGAIANTDLLLECKDDTPYNTLPTYVRGTGQQYLGGTECWGENDKDNWPWHRISKTVDVEKHLALDILGCTWNGWLWLLSHSSGGSRARLLDHACLYPIRTVTPGMSLTDPRQDRYLQACHFWDRNDNDTNLDSRWTRESIKIMNGTGGIAVDNNAIP